MHERGILIEWGGFYTTAQIICGKLRKQRHLVGQTRTTSYLSGKRRCYYIFCEWLGRFHPHNWGQRGFPKLDSYQFKGIFPLSSRWPTVTMNTKTAWFCKQCDFIGTAYKQQFHSLSIPDQRSDEAQPTKVHMTRKSNSFGWAHSKSGDLKLNQVAHTFILRQTHRVNNNPAKGGREGGKNNTTLKEKYW